MAKRPFHPDISVIILRIVAESGERAHHGCTRLVRAVFRVEEPRVAVARTRLGTNRVTAEILREPQIITEHGSAVFCLFPIRVDAVKIRPDQRYAFARRCKYRSDLPCTRGINRPRRISDIRQHLVSDPLHTVKPQLTEAGCNLILPCDPEVMGTDKQPHYFFSTR